MFESQSAECRDSVLPPAVTARASVEAASPLGWDHEVGQRGTIIGMRSFGISAPGKVAEAARPKDAVVPCGGFDSYLEELFLFFWLRDAGYDVVAFDRPEQGGVITAWLEFTAARVQRS